MKKLTIAAGIAFAIASSGASAGNLNTAHNYDITHASFASLNTTVSGTSDLIVTASNDKTIPVSDIKKDAQALGSFTVKVPDGETGIAISDVHSHGYSNGFKVKFNSCTLTADGGGVLTTVDTVDTSYQCAFTGTNNLTINVTTGDNALVPDIQPGVKTITTKFVSYHS